MSIEETTTGEENTADSSTASPAVDSSLEASVGSVDVPPVSNEAAEKKVTETTEASAGETADSGEGEEGDQEEEKPVSPYADQFEWYCIHAYSGFELKAKRAMQERIRSNEMQDYFGDILVPEEQVVELVKGKKKTSSRKFFPGYMLVQMVMNEDSWHIVKDTPKITGFVGDATQPVPLMPEEVERILSQVAEGAAAPKSRIKFEEGQAVKVVDGPFTDFNGTVDDVNPGKGKLRVLISIFGRATPVELDFIQVERI